MNNCSPWLVGRQEIADYAKCSPWMVTMMLEAGLRTANKRGRGVEPRTKSDWVDLFFETNPNFVARRYRRGGSDQK